MCRRASRRFSGAHGVVAGSLRELLVHQAANAIGPAEAQHPNGRGFRVGAPHRLASLKPIGLGFIVEVEAQKVDGSDHQLHAARSGQLGDPHSQLEGSDTNTTEYY